MQRKHGLTSSIFVTVCILNVTLLTRDVDAHAQIAFTSIRDGNPEIYVMDADGSNVLRLTHHFAWDAYPAWLPDGRVIAFTSLRNLAGEEIFLIHPDGTNLTHITKSVGRHMARSATWKPAPQPVSPKEKLATQLGRVKQSR